MIDNALVANHSHVFLGDQHHSAERRTWAVIWLCGAMMALEIGGGWLFGSIALIADGLHMSTHAGALLLAALAYTYSRKYAGDSRFTFGTGKLGDLAGFTSAIVLAMIALLIGYEAVRSTSARQSRSRRSASASTSSRRGCCRAAVTITIMGMGIVTAKRIVPHMTKHTRLRPLMASWR